MSILNMSGGLGVVGFLKGFGGETAGRIDGSTATRPMEMPVRRVRTAAVTHVREADRIEEDCERWDGLA